jgi:MraZ protein
MFRGTHHYSVDDKGRVAIPARFIKVLSGLQDECLVVTRFKRRSRPCLDVYPVSVWQRFEEKIAAEKRFNKKVAAFASWYVGAPRTSARRPGGC